MNELANQHCVPCMGGVAPLAGAELQALVDKLPDWHVIDGHHVQRTFNFDDFVGALAFVNRVGALAEAEGHHPDICFTWGRATVKVWTHKIDGLTESDFVLAAKIDRVVD